MTTISSGIGVPHRQTPGLAQTVRTWFSAERERQRVRRELRELAHLPDHLLRDMGLEHLLTRRNREFNAFWR